MVDRPSRVSPKHLEYRQSFHLPEPFHLALAAQTPIIYTYIFHNIKKKQTFKSHLDELDVVSHGHIENRCKVLQDSFARCRQMLQQMQTAFHQLNGNIGREFAVIGRDAVHEELELGQNGFGHNATGR